MLPSTICRRTKKRLSNQQDDQQQSKARTYENVRPNCLDMKVVVASWRASKHLSSRRHALDIFVVRRKEGFACEMEEGQGPVLFAVLQVRAAHAADG